MTDDYAKSLGARLRAIRRQQGLSLHAVEQRSEGRWKAAVVGSYERGDRAVTVQRLAELADFYQVPLTELLPDEPSAAGMPRSSSDSRRLVLNLERLAELPESEAEPLARFAAAIQSQRGDFNGRVLTLRGQDLTTLEVLYSHQQDVLQKVLDAVLHDDWTD